MQVALPYMPMTLQGRQGILNSIRQPAMAVPLPLHPPPLMCPSKRKMITRFWRKRSRTRHVLPLLDAIPAVLEYPKLYSRVFEYITCSSHTTTHTALNLTQCWKPVSPVPPF